MSTPETPKKPHTFQHLSSARCQRKMTAAVTGHAKRKTRRRCLKAETITAGWLTAWIARLRPQSRKCGKTDPRRQPRAGALCDRKLLVSAESDVSEQVVSAVSRAGYSCVAKRPPPKNRSAA